MKYVVFCMCRTIKILISNWPRKLKFSQFFRQGRHASCFWLFATRSRVGHALHPILMLWFDRWVHAENLCSILKLVYFAEADRVLCQLVMFLTVFFHWMYKWLVCLLVFWLKNTSLVNVGNPISDGIVFVFHLAGCVRGLKSLKRFWPYFNSFQCISNGKPE